jgi:hypothetical protein
MRRDTMRANIRDIIALFNISEEEAKKVEYNMDCLGIDYSECTKREFREIAKEAYEEFLAAA